jgi:type 1 fimbria pilin
MKRRRWRQGAGARPRRIGAPQRLAVPMTLACRCAGSSHRRQLNRITRSPKAFRHYNFPSVQRGHDKLLAEQEIMKMKIVCAVMAGVMISSSANAFADVDGDGRHEGKITITGRIRPGPCEINIDHGGHLDFGEINAADLKSDAPTKLESRSLPFEISCHGRTTVAISSENEVGTANPFLNWTEHPAHGPELHDVKGILKATDKDESVGVYLIHMDQMRIDTGSGKITSATPIRRETAGGSWAACPDREAVAALNLGTPQFSWSNDGETPAEAVAFYGTFGITPFIQPARNLDLNRTIEFQGESTITLTY